MVTLALLRHLVRSGHDVVAAKLLDNWDEEGERFVRVIPREYAAALARREDVGGPKTAEFRTLAA